MAFLEADFSDPVETLGDTAYSLANLLADAMLVRAHIVHMAARLCSQYVHQLYRLKVIWGDKWQIIVIPSLAYLTEIGGDRFEILGFFAKSISSSTFHPCFIPVREAWG